MVAALRAARRGGEGMKVYVVDHIDPRMIAGVFSSKQKALDYANKVFGQCEISEFEVDTPLPPKIIITISEVKFSD